MSHPVFPEAATGVQQAHRQESGQVRMTGASPVTTILLL